MHVSVPSGLLLSVLVVMLLTVFYELFKVWRVWLETKSQWAQPNLKSSTSSTVGSDSSTVLESSQSELSLTPGGRRLPAVNVTNRSASLWNSACWLINMFRCGWTEKRHHFDLQLGASRRPDAPPQSAGDPGLHADAVCHVVQHLDLLGRHRGLWSRIFHFFPALE